MDIRERSLCGLSLKEKRVLGLSVIVSPAHWNTVFMKSGFKSGNVWVCSFLVCLILSCTETQCGGTPVISYLPDISYAGHIMQRGDTSISGIFPEAKRSSRVYKLAKQSILTPVLDLRRLTIDGKVNTRLCGQTGKRKKTTWKDWNVCPLTISQKAVSRRISRGCVSRPTRFLCIEFSQWPILFIIICL